MEAARTLEHAGHAGACPVTGGIMRTYKKWFLTGHLAGLAVEYQSAVIPPTGLFWDCITGDLVYVTGL